MAQQLGTTIFAMKSFLPGVERRSAVVLGAGSAGLFFVHHLKRVGFETVILAEPLADRRLTATKLGADHVVDPFATSPGDLARELTSGIGCDLVIEAAGTREARRDAIDTVAARGRVGLFGYAEAPGEEPFPFADTWRKALTLVASANTQLEPGLASFKEAVDLIATKVVPVDHLLEDDVFPLSDVQQAFTTAQERRSNKVRVGLRS